MIGRMYLVTSLLFFALGGVMALLMRAELARPGMQFLAPEQYNQLVTMHGTVMLLLYATPILFGGLIVMSGFLTPGGAADFGWYAYAPLSGPTFAPGTGPDLWFAGLIV
ncbi:MAG: cytochrome c oxidase subunit, partial [Pseudonocardiales bacterium]|nr:cytochrome c oxidase subunit [Pseudonocardiales bacterium]